MPQTTYRPLIPPREAARILGICLPTLEKIVSEGRLTPVRISERRRGFRPDDLDAFMTPPAKATA